MPRLLGINHLEAIRALEKVGFWVARQSKHVIMYNGLVTLVIPRNNPIDAITMGGIIKQAGLTLEEFRNLL
jgi:predicted RNA binding protein YcfA (HicA-like mRNA interferase family)